MCNASGFRCSGADVADSMLAVSTVTNGGLRGFSSELSKAELELPKVKFSESDRYKIEADRLDQAAEEQRCYMQLDPDFENMMSS